MDEDGQINRLSRLVDDMLDVSRISTGKLQLQPERFDLSELAREVIERFSAQLQAAGLSIALDAPEPVIGFWDRYRVEQVFTNLVTNAMKYGAGKPIQVSVSATGNVAQLSVRDQGVGIAEEDQARIFRLFERATPSRKIAGLGLGLYIAKQFVDAHRGVIRLESEVGKGSSFKVELPISDKI